MSVDIRLKHSSTKDKAPVAADLKSGELALSIHPDSPAAYIKDADGNIVKLAGENSVSTDTDAVKKSETASQSMAGDLTLGTNPSGDELITLDAAEGTATFTEKVTIKSQDRSTLWLPNGAGTSASSRAQINFGFNEGAGSIKYNDVSNNVMSFNVKNQEIVRFRYEDDQDAGLQVSVGQSTADAMFCVADSSHFAYASVYDARIKLEKINSTGKITTDTLETTDNVTCGGGIGVAGGSVSNAKPGGMYYGPTEDFIALTARNYDSNNNPAADGDNSYALFRLSRKRDYDGNRIQVGGDLSIESLAGGINATAPGNISLGTTGTNNNVRLISAQDITLLPSRTLSVSGDSVAANQQLFQQTAAAPFNNQVVNVAYYYPKVQDTVFDESDTTTWLSSLNLFNLGLNNTFAGSTNPNVKSKTGLRLGPSLGSDTWSGTGDQLNYGILAQLSASGSSKNFNFAASGTAHNYFVGDTGIGNNDPQAKLDVIGQSKFTFSAPGTGAEVMLVNRLGNAAGTLIKFSEDGATAGNITLDNAGGVSYNESSDYRLKENVTNIESTVDLIKNIRPVNYNYISHPGATRQGFIAHELQESAPLAVTGTKDATEAIGTLADWDGTELETNIVEPDDLTYTEDVEVNGVTTQEVRTKSWTPTGTQPVYQGVDQTKLIPLLTKALQEALERIEALEAAAS